MPEISEATPVTEAEPISADANFEAALAAAIKETEDPGKADPAAIQEAETNAAVKAKDEAEAAEAKPKTEEAPKPEEPAKDSPGTLSKVRRLAGEGKMKEAIELALG